MIDIEKHRIACLKKMKYRRSPLGQLIDMLLAIAESGDGIRVSHICTNIRISQKGAEHFILKMKNSNLIDDVKIGNARIISLTTNGKLFLEECKKFRKVCESVNLEIRI